MANDTPDCREAILWRRVGTLAWIMGAMKSDNPFRKYESVIRADETRTLSWQNKLRSWDQGWEHAQRRAGPDRTAAARAALRCAPWTRMVGSGRKT
jgi:hypothetical protein